MTALSIKTNAFHLTEEELFNFCVQNEILFIERDKNQTIYINPLPGNIYALIISKICFHLYTWNVLLNSGKVFSNVGYFLPNKAMRGARISWVTIEKWNILSLSEKEKFAHICPDFVIELRSGTDSLKQLREKMEEWIENGCRLAWLIDPTEEKTYIYRPGKETEIFTGFDRKISGENILSGFELDLRELR